MFGFKGAAMVAAVGLGFAAHAGAATTFNFLFDDSGGGSPDGTIGSPIVGAGLFISPVDLTPGVYSLDSLTGYSFAALVDGVSFTDADLATPSSGVSVGITQVGGVERLVFTETPGDPGADGGPVRRRGRFCEFLWPLVIRTHFCWRQHRIRLLQ